MFLVLCVAGIGVVDGIGAGVVDCVSDVWCRWCYWYCEKIEVWKNVTEWVKNDYKRREHL